MTTFVHCDGDEYRQIGCTRGKNRCAHIGQRGLRFNCKKIDARLIECSDLLAVQVVYVVKVGLTKSCLLYTSLYNKFKAAFPNAFFIVG